MNSTYLKTLRLALAALAVGFVLLTVVSSTSRGALIEYAWQGTIVPNDPAEDPWGIGSPSLRFTISGFADEGADDLLPDESHARFDLSAAVLLIDGEMPVSFGRARVGFSESVGKDSIDISIDDVIFNGVAERFFTGAQLPTSTFTLTGDSETPPLFSPAMILSTTGSVSGRSSYTTFVEGGAFVTSTLIPEPSTFILMLLGTLGAGITRWRGRSK
ncbi:MAG: PEP-CTERM sorting domain-containing protein [Planctomycetes bacterium]|nr:PEP-CTERM sorting domain-containing protein [Planctomycetota bacterium]